MKVKPIWAVAVAADLIVDVDELTTHEGGGRSGFDHKKTPKGKEHQGDSTQKHENVCYRCRSNGHWSRTCRTPPHVCKLYQDYAKGKWKEVNFAEYFEGTS